MGAIASMLLILVVTLEGGCEEKKEGETLGCKLCADALFLRAQGLGHKVQLVSAEDYLNHTHCRS